MNNGARRFRHLSNSRRSPSLLLLLSFMFFLPHLVPRVLFSLEYGTFLGAWGLNDALDLRLDQAGNLLVTGETTSEEFPVTSGAYDESANGESEIYLSLFTPDLSVLLASTLLGGRDGDQGKDVVLAANGDVLVTGMTKSDDFPVTGLAWDPFYNGGFTDAYLARLSPDLSTLLAATYLGGAEGDWANSLVLDDAGNVYVFGGTTSDVFPTTPGAFDAVNTGQDAFITLFEPDLREVLVSTLLGGDGADCVTGAAMDRRGDIVMVGATHDDFPVTADAFDTSANGGEDAFAAVMPADLSRLLHATYIGGYHYDNVFGMALGAAGDVVFTGYTQSSDYPTTLGAFDSTFDGSMDIFVSSLSADLTALRASTFVGGEGSDIAWEAVIDGEGLILVTGSTDSYQFPTTPGAFDSTFSSDSEDFADAVLVKLLPDLSALAYSTYIGARFWDEGKTLTVDERGNAFVAGSTDSPNFPIPPGAFDRTFSGVWDVFIVKFLSAGGRSGIVAGPGPGPVNPTVVRTWGGTWPAYGGSGYGTNVACGDLDGDGVDEVVTGPGPGESYGPHVRAFTPRGAAFAGVSFLAYGTPRWGVNVACGDLDADGRDEIVTGPGPGAVYGPHVRGWRCSGGGTAAIAGVSFLAYGTHRYGLNVACGDLDGDGRDEIVTGAGPGALFGPHVRGWDCDGGAGATAIPGLSFLAYATHGYGVNVACGDLDGDGRAEILTGPGPSTSSGPRVRAWRLDGAAVSPMAEVDFFAYGGARYGVQVAGWDVDGDGFEEILTMPGPDPAQPARVRAWNVDGGAVTRLYGLESLPFGEDSTYGGKIAAGQLRARF